LATSSDSCISGGKLAFATSRPPSILSVIRVEETCAGDFVQWRRMIINKYSIHDSTTINQLFLKPRNALCKHLSLSPSSRASSIEHRTLSIEHRVLNNHQPSQVEDSCGFCYDCSFILDVEAIQWRNPTYPLTTKVCPICRGRMELPFNEPFARGEESNLASSVSFLPVSLTRSKASSTLAWSR
jgi:hypothetical protein